MTSNSRKVDKVYHSSAILKTNFVEVDDSNKFVFTGLASTFGNVDLVGDVIERGAFAASIDRLKRRGMENEKRGLMPILFNHDANQPLGAFIELEEDDEGLRVKGEMPKDDVFVAGRIVPQMRAGSISTMSIGFFIRSDRVEGVTRFIDEIDLVETSLVTFAANPRALVTDLKSSRITADDLDEIDIRELERQLRGGAPMSKTLATAVASLLMERRRDAAIRAGQGDPDPSSPDLRLDGDMLNLFNRMTESFDAD